MKKILFTVLIANALIILSLSSCTKEDLSSGAATSNSNSSSPVIPPLTSMVIANDWVNYSNQVFVCTLKGAIPVAYAGGNFSIKVYLAENGKETQINSPITYMGNQLWARISQTDVIVVYRCSAPNLPFRSLSLKVVIE